MDKQSLHQHYRSAYDVPVGLVMAASCLVVGLSLPFMSVQQLFFWEDDYSIFTSIKGMWAAGHYVISVIITIFFFSIIFPFAKLITWAVIWYKPLDPESRGKGLPWLGLLGKWPMPDVFVVAILIVLTQSKGYVGATPQAGLYVFAAAILLSMLVSLRVEHLAKTKD